MSDTKNTKSSQPTTRQVVLSEMIDITRRDVIRNDIELQFLKSGTIPDEVFDRIYAPGVKDDNIKLYQAHYEYNLGKLQFLKNMRDENIAKSITKNTPDILKIKK
jgi:hypothetical protein